MKRILSLILTVTLLLGTMMPCAFGANDNQPLDQQYITAGSDSRLVENSPGRDDNAPTIPRADVDGESTGKSTEPDWPPLLPGEVPEEILDIEYDTNPAQEQNPRYSFIDKDGAVVNEESLESETCLRTVSDEVYDDAGSELVYRDQLRYGGMPNYETVKANILRNQKQFDTYLAQGKASEIWGKHRDELPTGFFPGGEERIDEKTLLPVNPVQETNPLVQTENDTQTSSPANDTGDLGQEPSASNDVSNTFEETAQANEQNTDTNNQENNDTSYEEEIDPTTEGPLQGQPSINAVEDEADSENKIPSDNTSNDTESNSVEESEIPSETLRPGGQGDIEQTLTNDSNNAVDNDEAGNITDESDDVELQNDGAPTVVDTQQPPASENDTVVGNQVQDTDLDLSSTETEAQIPEETVRTQTTDSLNWYDYNIMVGPAAMNNLNKAQYSAFKDNQEIISPQTGDLTLKTTDIYLPGRNGLDLDISRIFQSNKAIAGDRWSDSFLTSYVDYSTYDMERYGLGLGWSLGFPSVEVRSYGENRHLYYHDGNGAAYEVKFTADTSDSNLDNYDLKDVQFNNDAGTFNNGQVSSSYVLVGRNQTKQYFAEDGRLLGIVDRFGNTINFEYSNILANNRCPDYTFGGDESAGLWSTDAGFHYDDSMGLDDDNSLKFQSCGGYDACTSFSALVPVVPGEQYYIHGYINNQLSSGYSGLACFQFDENGEYVHSTGDMYGPTGWAGVEIFVPVFSESRYLCLAFCQEAPYGYLEGSSHLDVVRLCRENPVISEITDSIGREVEFTYEDMTDMDFNDLPGRIIITVNDPTSTNTYSLSYDRGSQPYGHTWRLQDGTLACELRKIFTLDKVTNGDIESQFNYTKTTRYFSFKNWNSSIGWNAHLPQFDLTEWQVNTNQANITKVMYEYENVRKHLGEEGYYEQDRISSRYEQPAGTQNTDYRQDYSYAGIYDGTNYDNETGYSSTVQEPDRSEDDDYEFTTTVTESVGGRSHVDNVTVKGAKSYKTESSYNSGADMATSTVEEYDAAFPKQPTKIKLEESNGSETNTLYKGYTYNNWGGVASETRPLTAEQWDNATKRSQNTTSYTYDPTYKLLTSTSYYQSPGIQLTSSAVYDSQGRMTSSTDAKGQTASYAYEDLDHPGNLTSTTIALPGGAASVAELSYTDASGTEAYPTAVTQHYTENGISRTAVTNKTYDYLWGSVSSETDAANNTITYTYDNMGRVATIVYPASTGKDGNYTLEEHFTYSYPTLNDIKVFKVRQEKRKDGNPIYYTENFYDSHGNLVDDAVWDNEKSQWLENKYQYDAYGQLFQYTDPKNNQTTCSFDDMNRLQWIQDAQGNKQQNEYDIVNRTKTSYFIPTGGSRQNDYTESYDQWGNIISRKGYPDGFSNPNVIEETYQYDLLGNCTGRIDPENNSTTYQYDQLNRLVAVTNALGETTDYSYDRLGGLKTQTQYQGSSSFVTTKDYDERGLQTSKTEPLGGDYTYQYTYNAQGLLASLTDPKGNQYSYQYYDDGRLSQSSVGSSSITNYYHPLGSIERYTVAGGGDGLDYSYSSTGLTLERTSNNRSVAFEYDLNGNVIGRTDPFALNLDYAIDSLNRTQSITAAGKTFGYEYNGDGTIKKVTYPNGITSEYTYDNIRRLQTIQNKNGSLVLSSFSYAYDKNGNITSVTNTVSGATTNYDYDALNRLVAISKPDGSQIQYSYDSRGNRIPLTGVQTTSQEAKTGTFSYNGWDEMSGYSGSAGTYSYEYDPEGLRAKKTGPTGTTRYYCDNAGRVIAEANGSDQVTAEIIWGHKPLARKIGSNFYYYLYNGHGDVIALADESGNLVNTYTYDEWGKVLSETEQIPNPIRYAGEYYDEETGLYYLRARYYDPLAGRFISKDSYEGDVANPLSLNLYAYCAGNPLVYIDPSGCDLSPWDCQYVTDPGDKYEIIEVTRAWYSATTDAGRYEAHMRAEAIRDKYRAINEIGTGDGNTITTTNPDEIAINYDRRYGGSYSDPIFNEIVLPSVAGGVAGGLRSGFTRAVTTNAADDVVREGTNGIKFELQLFAKKGKFPTGSVSGKEVINFLKKEGFEVVSQKGSHVKLKAPNGNTIIVPEHGNKSLGKGLLEAIKKQAGY